MYGWEGRGVIRLTDLLKMNISNFLSRPTLFCIYSTVFSFKTSVFSSHELLRSAVFFTPLSEDKLDTVVSKTIAHGTA